MTQKTMGKPNRPGSATNTPQHSAEDYGGDAIPQRDGLPTGVGTAGAGDVADPHPSEEEHPYAEARPGGAPGTKSTRLRINRE